MPELLAAAMLTTLATGLGAIPVFVLGQRVRAWEPALMGLAAGVMAVAAVAGLLVPALEEGSNAQVGAGLLAGVGFLLLARVTIAHDRRGARLTASNRTALLVFAVLFVHSLPEGFAIGTAYASETQGLGLFIVIAIAIQNIPEGTSVAIPMEAAGHSGAQQFWAAVGTSAPQPVGAAIAYVLVEEISGLLPVSFAFAAGAMLALVVVEVAPEALAGSPRRALAGMLIGGAFMLILSIALQV